MSLITRLSVIFYVSIIWITSILLILFVVHVIELEVVMKYVALAYRDSEIGTAVIIIAGLFMIMSYLLARIMDGRRQMERTIAFDNPGGPVTVSLIALEDLIKRLIVQLPEVKEMRPYIIATRKGLEVDIKLILRHEVNIPELTGRIQDLVRKKVEEAIGMEGKISVRVHVIKISLEDIKGFRKGDVQASASTQVPFHGYRS